MTHTTCTSGLTLSPMLHILKQSLTPPHNLEPRARFLPASKQSTSFLRTSLCGDLRHTLLAAGPPHEPVCDPSTDAGLSTVVSCSAGLLRNATTTYIHTHTHRTSACSNVHVHFLQLTSQASCWTRPLVLTLHNLRVDLFTTSSLCRIACRNV